MHLNLVYTDSASAKTTLDGTDDETAITALGNEVPAGRASNADVMVQAEKSGLAVVTGIKVTF